ncbi:MAG: hypothetical protein ACBZ72_09550 [Candidatus Bathyarchaeia archaeon]|jgi:hypothetical protein
MQTNLSTLLLITSAVIFSCIVINYATVVFTQTLQTPNIPQLEQYNALQEELLNQTQTLLNQTLPQTPNNASQLAPRPK